MSGIGNGTNGPFCSLLACGHTSTKVRTANTISSIRHIWAAVVTLMLQDGSGYSQEAHVTQGRLVRKLEAQICDSEQTLDTVKSQEKVIGKLENVLKQATQERRAAVATATKLQQQLEALDSRLDTSTAQVVHSFGKA